MTIASTKPGASELRRAHYQLETNMNRRTLTATQAEQHALTMALVLAITAKTEANSQRAVLAAGFFAGRMQPLQVAQCQTEAKRILKSAYN